MVCGVFPRRKQQEDCRGDLLYLESLDIWHILCRQGPSNFRSLLETMDLQADRLWQSCKNKGMI